MGQITAIRNLVATKVVRHAGQQQRHFSNPCKAYLRHDMQTQYTPFVREIHRSTVDSPTKGPCCGALAFFLCC